jgi:hypothetical protein
MSLDLSNLADDMKGGARPRVASGAGLGTGDEGAGGGVIEESGLTGVGTVLAKRTAVLWVSKRMKLYEVLVKPGESVAVTATALHQRPLLQVRQALPHDLEETKEQPEPEETQEKKPQTLEQKLGSGISISLGTGVSIPIPIPGDTSDVGSSAMGAEDVAIATEEDEGGVKVADGGLVWMEKEEGNIVTWYSRADIDPDGEGTSPPVSPTNSSWGDGTERAPYFRIVWTKGRANNEDRPSSAAASFLGMSSIGMGLAAEPGVSSASSCVTIGVPWMIFNWTNEPLRLHSWPHEGGEAWRLAPTSSTARTSAAATTAAAAATTAAVDEEDTAQRVSGLDSAPVVPSVQSTYAHFGEESTISIELEVGLAHLNHTSTLL